MSKWYTESEIALLSSEEGLPDNHVITVVEREISIDDPELIQNNVRTDTFTLDLDAEYDDLNVVVIFTKPNGVNIKVAYNGDPTHIPGSAMELVGGLACSVVGVNEAGEVRAVTKAAPNSFQVVESGAFDGSVTSDDAELLGQILAAMSGVEEAAESANTAASNANTKANLANTAASSANSAASSANSAASSANSAATKATTAATNAENAYEALQPVMATLDSNINQPTRRVGPGTQVSGGDSFAAKPAEIVVYGNTTQNLWVNPETNSAAGISFNPNSDGSISISGTVTAGLVIQIEAYTLKPNTKYILSVDKAFPNPAGQYFCVGYKGGAALHVGPGVFTTSSDTSNLVCAFVVSGIGLNQDISGTYRVMLNEGSEPLPWVKPGLNSVGDAANKVTIKISDEGKQDGSPTVFEVPLIDSSDNVYTLNSLPDGTRDELRVDADGNAVLTKRVNSVNIPSSMSSSATWGSDYGRAVLNNSVFGADGVNTPHYISSDFGITKYQMHDKLPIGGVTVPTAGDPYSYAIMSKSNIYLRVNGKTNASDVFSAIGDSRFVYRLATPQTIQLKPVTVPQLPSPAFTAWVDDDTETDLEVKYVRDISEALEQVNYLDYNSYTGCYSRSGIAAFVNHYRDGKIYGYRQYKSTEVALDRLGSNAGMTTPIPGTAEIPATDGYFEKGPFFWCNVNGKVDQDGNLDVTAIERDLKFSLTDPDGDVATLTPTLYYHVEETDDYIDTYICDSPLAGFEIQPGGKAPGGKVRPFMLHAKYAASQDASGRVRSVSGAKPLLFVSHNSLITLCDNANTGYSAYNVADDWYIKTMFMLKYATKNSQTKFYGAANYYLQYKATVAESDVNRVIIAKSQANNLVVGSCCSLGSNPSGGSSLDRGNAQARDIFHLERITKIEDYDTNNSAVYFEGIEPFTTTTNCLLATMPWWTGSCDNVQGDGSPVSGNSSKYPFTMQGIELMLGTYEIMGNVILKNTGDGWKAYANPDSKYEKTAYNASYYTDTGLILPTDANNSWKYPLYCKTFNGLISSDHTGGSSSTGMCDGIYTNNLSTSGEREWRSFGSLGYGAAAGLFCVDGNSSLSLAGWVCGARLSFVGRSEG